MRLTELEKKIIDFGEYIKSISDNPNVSRHQLAIDTEKKVINLNCSCYTRECTTDKLHGRYNRQTVYKGLVHVYRSYINSAVRIEDIPTKEYPFGGANGDYNIDLVYEENNSHDPNSTMLILNSGENKALYSWNNYNLGYIPGSMSEFFNTHKKYFTNIKIRTIYNNLPNKKQAWNPLHNVRLSVFYRDTELFKMAPGMGRFKSFE